MEDQPVVARALAIVEAEQVRVSRHVREEARSADASTRLVGVCTLTTLVALAGLGWLVARVAADDMAAGAALAWAGIGWVALTAALVLALLAGVLAPPKQR